MQATTNIKPKTREVVVFYYILTIAAENHNISKKYFVI